LDAETEAAKGRANPEVAGESAIPGHAGPAGPGEARAVGRDLGAGVGAAKPAAARNRNRRRY